MKFLSLATFMVSAKISIWSIFPILAIFPVPAKFLVIANLLQGPGNTIVRLQVPAQTENPIVVDPW